MADRRVTRSEKNKDGDIIGLCWAGENGLEHVSRVTAINHITQQTHRYFVAEVEPAVWVLARPAAKPTYLTTEADGESANNLDNLDDCP